jgi:hypothetical protein
MFQGYDSQRFVLCAVQAVFECQCGERLVLLGREEDWYAEGRTTFECGGCGRSITLGETMDEVQPPSLIGGPDEEDESIRDLLRSLNPPFGRG